MAAFKDIMHEHKSQHCIRQQSPGALPIISTSTDERNLFFPNQALVTRLWYALRTAKCVSNFYYGELGHKVFN